MPRDAKPAPPFPDTLPNTATPEANKAIRMPIRQITWQDNIKQTNIYRNFSTYFSYMIFNRNVNKYVKNVSEKFVCNFIFQVGICNALFGEPYSSLHERMYFHVVFNKVLQTPQLRSLNELRKPFVAALY